MRNIIRGLSAIALTASLGACATVTRGTSEQFVITSTPPGAQAHTSSGFNCESTPCTIRMPRKDSFSVTVSKAGYKTVQAEVKTKIAGTGAAGFVGNALIGGVIGGTVDVVSGATLDLTPNPLNIDLVAVETPPPAPAAPVTAAPAGAAAPVSSPPAATPTPVASVGAPATVAAK